MSRTASQAAGAPKRRRRRFSLNGLAIQLSAFAISSTLVALLVVSGSQAAFVEENESVTNYVPLGAPAEDPPSRPRAPRTPAPGPTPAPPAAASPTAPTAEAPDPPEEAPEPAQTPAPSVQLTDSDAGTALFTEDTVLAPGVTLDRCIEVSYDGEPDPDPVLLHAARVDGALTPYLELAVDIGPAGDDAFGACGGFLPTATVYSGTLAHFAAAHGSAAQGLPTWDPAGEAETRSFRFRVSVRDDPAAAGLTATFGFTWESRVR